MSSLDPFYLIDKLRVHVFVCDTSASITGLSVTGDLNMNGFRIINLGTPLLPTDAATKLYVDSIATSGLPAGANTQIQYNNLGMFGADANFTWRTASQVFAISGAAPAAVVGSQTPDVGPALQLKTNIAPGTISVLAGPSQLTYQTSVTTVGAVSSTLLAFQLTNKTAAYCDVTVNAITTAGPNQGSVGTIHSRFYFKLITGVLTVSTVTTDFNIVEVAGMAVSVAASGTVLNVNVTGTALNTHVWNGQATLYVTAAWP
jgi:hypothetical protein